MENTSSMDAQISQENGNQNVSNLAGTNENTGQTDLVAPSPHIRHHYHHRRSWYEYGGVGHRVRIRRRNRQERERNQNQSPSPYTDVSTMRCFAILTMVVGVYLIFGWKFIWLGTILVIAPVMILLANENNSIRSLWNHGGSEDATTTGTGRADDTMPLPPPMYRFDPNDKPPSYEEVVTMPTSSNNAPSTSNTQHPDYSTYSMQGHTNQAFAMAESTLTEPYPPSSDSTNEVSLPTNHHSERSAPDCPNCPTGDITVDCIETTDDDRLESQATSRQTFNRANEYTLSREESYNSEYVEHNENCERRNESNHETSDQHSSADEAHPSPIPVDEISPRGLSVNPDIAGDSELEKNGTSLKDHVEQNAEHKS